MSEEEIYKQTREAYEILGKLSKPCKVCGEQCPPPWDNCFICDMIAEERLKEIQEQQAQEQGK